nr:hypothetical protein [Tanacetum cinerariifolium]
ARRRTGLGQNAAGPHLGFGHRFAVSPHPVHARLDADRHPRYRSAGRRPRHGAPLVQVQPGAYFR